MSWPASPLHGQKQLMAVPGFRISESNNPLAVELKPVLRQRFADATFPLGVPAPLNDGLVVIPIHISTIRSGFGSYLTGSLGVVEHLGRVAALSGYRYQAHADAHVSARFVPCELEVLDDLAQGATDLDGHLPGTASEQQGELIALHSRQGVALAHGFPHAPCELPQQLVSGGPSQALVDAPELIQIHVADGVFGAAGSGTLQRTLQALDELPLVCQTRQRVVNVSVGDVFRYVHHGAVVLRCLYRDSL